MKRIVKWSCYACLLTSLWSSSVFAQSLSRGAMIVAQRAQTLFESKQVDKAVSILTDFKSQQAYDKAYIQQMLGVYYWQLDNVSKSEHALSSAVNSNQLTVLEAWSTQRMLADILLSQQKYVLALRQYEMLLKRKPVPKGVSVSEVWLRIAQIHYQEHQWDKTLKAMSNYRRIKGKVSVLSLSLMANAQLQLQQWRLAEQNLLKLRDLDSGNSAWWQQLLFVQLKIFAFVFDAGTVFNCFLNVYI